MRGARWRNPRRSTRPWRPPRSTTGGCRWCARADSRRPRLTRSLNRMRSARSPRNCGEPKPTMSTWRACCRVWSRLAGSRMRRTSPRCCAPRVAAVVSRDTGAGRTRRAPRLVAGLIPRAIGPMDAAMHRALVERAGLIESRASTVLGQALRAGEPWTRALSVAPRGSSAAAWHQSGCTVAAHRDRYGIVGAKPLGAAPESRSQRVDAARARAALEAAQRFTASSSDVAPRPAAAWGLTR